jgi:hypothetical protein
MQVKILMSWDIKPGRDQEYFEFVVREFAPGITRLGLQPTEAWYTLYGKRSQIMMGGIAEDYKKMKVLLASKEWAELHERLIEFVANYQQKIVRLSPYFQIF